MSSQKWIVFFTFLVLFTFMEEAKLFSACKEEIIKDLKNIICALENCNCNGKSFTFTFTLQRETNQGGGIFIPFTAFKSKMTTVRVTLVHFRILAEYDRNYLS